MGENNGAVIESCRIRLEGYIVLPVEPEKSS